jgi:hypothetical protein
MRPPYSQTRSLKLTNRIRATRHCQASSLQKANKKRKVEGRRWPKWRERCQQQLGGVGQVRKARERAKLAEAKLARMTEEEAGEGGGSPIADNRCRGCGDGRRRSRVTQGFDDGVPLKLPLTFEIIMCFTLNSARECAGSIFQVIVEAGGTVLVDILSCPFVQVVRCGWGSNLHRDQSTLNQ